VLHGDPISIPKLTDTKESSKSKEITAKKEAKVYLPESESDTNAEEKVKSEPAEEKEPSPDSIEDVPAKEVKIDESLEELFSIEEATELSHKLSLTPIKDLKKSMGINEKIFTVTELFNGDQKLFDECLTALNDFKNFEEAKKFLAIGPASDFDWSEKSKQKKAKTFIKLVHRRYQ
jgi:hypothetical protein